MPVVNGKKYPYTAKGKAAAKKAAGAGYATNIVKEVRQTAKSASNAVDKYLNGNRPLPKGMKIGKSNVKAQVGQLAGAVLQGRRYDESGKMITPAKNKSGAKTPKRVTRSAKAAPSAPRQIMPKKVTSGVKPRGGRPLKKGM